MILNKIKLKAIKGIFADKVFFLLLLCFSFLFYQLLDFQVLKEKGGGLYVGLANYGDLPMHLAFITNFSYGKNFPPENPFFAQTPLRYPFLSDLLSGILLYLKLNLRNSIIFPTFLFFVIFFSLNYFLTKALFDKLTALFSTLIFLLGPNLGFYYFLRETWLKNDSLLSAFGNLKRHYNCDFNIRFYNIFTNLFIPERSLLAGLIFALSAIFLLFSGLVKKKRRDFLYAGLVTGSLPLWHVHSFLAVIIIACFWFLIFFSKSYIKDWLWFFAPVFLLALPQILWLLPAHFMSSFIHLQFGWVKSQENFFLFWFRNFGLIFILAPIGFLQFNHEKRKFFLPAFFLFFLTNIVVFQPWDWDNIKIFIICYWFFSILAATFLKSLRNYGLVGKLSVLFLFIGITAYFPLAYRLETSISHRLYSKEDVKFALWLINHTKVEAVFVTSTRHNHPVSTLAGRRTFLGFPGYLWVHGIDYQRRGKLLSQIFSGTGNLQKNFATFKISYVVWDEQSVEQYQQGLKYYQATFPQVYKDKNFIVFKVNL